MGIVSTLLAAAVLAGPPVEVSTFAGAEHQGELKSLAEGKLVLSTEAGEKSIAMEDVLELRLPEKGGSPSEPAPKEVLLTDGSRLSCEEVTSTKDEFIFKTTSMGTLKIPAEAVSSVRLAPHSNALAEEWSKLAKRQENKDLLVIPKNNLLDFLSGVVGPISDDKVQFLLGGNPVGVNREKVFGMVYGNRKPPTATAICRANLPNKDSVEFQSLTWTGKGFEGRLLSGPVIALPTGTVANLDFSLGKVQYLSDITPRKKEVTVPLAIDGAPPSPIELSYHDVKTNQNFTGKPLQLGSKVYARGLCIHSKTELAYRLSKEMRRFQAMMGIDNYVAQNGLGDVHVVIKADDKTLLDTIVRGTDEPKKLDLDVTGVVVLDILVDFVGDDDLGVGDHLDLADAKFIK